MNKRGFFRVDKNPVISILLILMLMGVASCAPATVPSPAIPPTATQTALPTQTQPPTITPTATSIPTATETPFIPKATIKIFTQGPLTGQDARGGIELNQAVELAIEQLSGPLAELGYKVELAAFNDQNTVERGVANAREITADPQVLCGVGHSYGVVTNAALEIYHQAGLAILAPNGDEDITGHGYLEANRLMGNNVAQGAAAAQYAHEQGFVKAVTLNSPWGAYGSRNTYNFKVESVLLGSPLVVFNETTDLVQGGFDKIIARLLASNAEVVFFAANGDQVGAFFREARAAGYMGTFMGPNSLSSTWILDHAGPLLLDGGGMFYTKLTAPASSYPNAATFITDYTSKYHTAPGEGIVNIYDGAAICLKAIEEASRAKGGELPTRGEVAKAIRALVDYQGIAGIYNFNKNGDLMLAEYYIAQAVTLDPAKWSQNPIVAFYPLPPPK